MSNDPHSSSIQVVRQYEVWDGNRHEPTEFAFWSIIWTDGLDYFYFHYKDRQLPDDISSLTPLASIIPRSYYLAQPPLDLQHAPQEPSNATYIKVSAPFYVDEPGQLSTTEVADQMIKEARIYAILAQNPHPNICEYYGIYVKDGLMRGLCLKRYSKTLMEAVMQQDDLDADEIISGIQQGLMHLHGLGYVHCDVNPSNIVLDSAKPNIPVIIDFDSCYARGTKITGKGGTFPWSDDRQVAEVSTDEFGLRAIEKWLRKRNRQN